MKALFTLLLCLLLCSPLFSQISCDDYDLLLEEKVPSGNCYQRLTFTVKTSSQLNGIEPEPSDWDSICSPTNTTDYTYYKYKLQIISTTNGSIVSEKYVVPQDYNFYRNNHYFYIVNYDDYQNSFGQLYGKLTIERYYFLPQIHNGFWQCPNGAHMLQTECETSRVNGCPPPQPNLRLKALTVNNNGQNYNLTSGQVPNIYFGENATFEAILENNGNADASSSPFALYASAYRYAFNQNLDVYQFASGDGGSIPAGSTKKVTLYHTFYEYVGALQLSNSSVYRIYSYMDHVNRIPESNESLSDNVREFAWRYIKTGSTTDPEDEEPCILCPTDDTGRVSNAITAPYKIETYNFSGIFINSALVKTEAEARNLIKSLPKGLYIIKTPFGDRKISKD
ncbi:CARDB domain-containing protein [Ascidiimonas sp. W6]|uniref:CARDB domain-containing protein n=1 Tax=Ascidiimonas meishanensis TaxID=3128903 RepID=UPI0030EBCB30